MNDLDVQVRNTRRKMNNEKDLSTHIYDIDLILFFLFSYLYQLFHILVYKVMFLYIFLYVPLCWVSFIFS